MFSTALSALQRKKPLSQLLFKHSGPANSLLTACSGASVCFCSFSESIMVLITPSYFLFLKAMENTRFVMHHNLFSHSSVALAGGKYTIMNNCLHRQESASPVAGYQAQCCFFS